MGPIEFIEQWMPIKAFVLLFLSQYLVCALACMVMRRRQLQKEWGDLADHPRLQQQNGNHAIMLGLIAGTLSVIGVALVYFAGRLFENK
jgi:hypothetical protein